MQVGRLGRVLESAAVLEEVLELDPSCTMALSFLAAIRVKEERSQTQPCCSRTRPGLLLKPLDACRTEEGVRLYRKCLSVDPSNTMAGEGLATILTDEGTRLKQAGQVGEPGVERRRIFDELTRRKRKRKRKGRTTWKNVCAHSMLGSEKIFTRTRGGMLWGEEGRAAAEGEISKSR